jgi:predicted AAA+ superfamily ATPase
LFVAGVSAWFILKKKDVVNQGNQRYYIQVAYDMISEEKQTQEFNSLRNIPDSFKKIVAEIMYFCAQN